MIRFNVMSQTSKVKRLFYELLTEVSLYFKSGLHTAFTLTGDIRTLSSYGKRRKRREVSDTKGQVKVASVIFINDRFKGQPSPKQGNSFTSSLDWAAAEAACDLAGNQGAKSNGFFDEVCFMD